jgi:hypothetical protein
MGWTLAQLQNRDLDIGIEEVPVIETRSIFMAAD